MATAQTVAGTGPLGQGLASPSPGSLRQDHAVTVPPAAGDSPSSSPGPNPASVFRSADVTSRGGEPGWRKEPPSGFREPDLSPGEIDTE